MKSITIYSIRVVAVVAFVIGIFMMIAGFGAQHDFGYIIDGLSLIMGSFVVLGFSYVVEAACLYITKCENEGFETPENEN